MLIHPVFRVKASRRSLSTLCPFNTPVSFPLLVFSGGDREQDAGGSLDGRPF